MIRSASMSSGAKDHVLRAGPPSAVSALAFLAAQVLRGGDASIPEIVLTTTGLFLLLLVVNWIISRQMARAKPELLVPESLNSLRTIINSCARSASEEFEYTTVGDFLQKIEARLAEGDEMNVLTHDIDAYDGLAPAVEALAQNLRRGVRYNYYMPDNSRSTLMQAASFFDRLEHEMHVAGSAPAAARDRLDSLVSLYLHPHALLYYFAMIRRGGGNLETSWYITSPNDRKPDRSLLVTTRLSEGNRDLLVNVFDKLRRESKRLSPNEVGKLLRDEGRRGRTRTNG